MKTYLLIDPQQANGLYYKEFSNIAEAVSFFTVKACDMHGKDNYRKLEGEMKQSFEFSFMLENADGSLMKESTYHTVPVFVIHELNNIA